MKKRTSTRASLAVSLLLAAGCAGTGQPEVDYLAFADAAPPSPIAAPGGWTVTLEEAKVAFGPVQFCAAATGSATLCDVAIAELLTIVQVDGLDPAPQPLGRVRGFEGAIQSASFDYGVHWFATEASPAASPAAPGGHSAHLRGRATRGDEAIDFTADIDVVAQNQGQRAVPSVEAAATVDAEPVRLDVRFDVGAWFERVKFDTVAAAGPGPVAFAPGSSAYEAIVQAMTDRYQHPPEFVWSTQP